MNSIEEKQSKAAHTTNMKRKKSSEQKVRDAINQLSKMTKEERRDFLRMKRTEEHISVSMIAKFTNLHRTTIRNAIKRITEKNERHKPHQQKHKKHHQQKRRRKRRRRR